MSSPIDVVLCFHNAFRRDIAEIDSQVLDIVRSDGNLTPVLDRLHVMDEILDYHARGEEAAVFPAVDNVAPLVARAYLMDHRELDKMVETLEGMRLQKSPDPLLASRATAVLNSHLRIHLDKEDAHLYPILREKTTVTQQVAMGGIMSSKIPPDRFPAAIAWLFPIAQPQRPSNSHEGMDDVYASASVRRREADHKKCCCGRLGCDCAANPRIERQIISPFMQVLLLLVNIATPNLDEIFV